MAQYAYDETGAIFNYFLLTILAFVLIPASYSWLYGGSKGRAHGNECKCDRCQAKRIRLAAIRRKEEPLISVRFILLVLGWALFAFVLYKAATTSVEEKGLWDPYVILGVDRDATKKEIKDSYKALMLIWHPDKNRDRQEESTKMSEDILKAYKTLTDEEARQNWDEWGHPDGKQAFQLGLALPKWLVEEGNNMKVLLVYGAVFGLLLPAAVARWWSNAKRLNKDKILNPTMAKFYRELKETLGFKALLELVCKADEFYTLISLDKSDGPALEQLTEQVKTAMEQKTSDRWTKRTAAKDPETAMQQKVSLLLNTHLLRITPTDAKLAEEQRIVAEKSVQLVGGLLQIAISRQWLNVALSVVDLGQLITQALYSLQSPLMQLPFITHDKLKHFRTKKRDVATIRDLLELGEKDRKDLLRFLEPEQYDLLIHVACQYPLLRITKAKFSVLGEPAIIPNAIVTLTIRLELGSINDLHKDKEAGSSLRNDNDDDEEEEPKNNWWDNKPLAPLVHAPYFPEDKRPVWWVYFGDMKQNRLITVGKVNDLINEKTVMLQFQAPPKTGQWAFQVFVKSDSHVGCDALCELKLVVEPPEAAPLQEEEDDISEPEEDSIAGQMQAMRQQKGGAGPKVNGQKKTHDESDSESDEENKSAGRRKQNGSVDDYEDSDDSEDLDE